MHQSIISRVAESEGISLTSTLGDLNINLLCADGSNCLLDTMAINGLKCTEEQAIWCIFNTPIINDVIMTNISRIASSPKSTGFSDFHHFVGNATKLCVPRVELSMMTYRSYRKFDGCGRFSWSNVFLLISLKLCTELSCAFKKSQANVFQFTDSKYREVWNNKPMAHNDFFLNGRE